MDKWQALQSFWSSFTIPAYDENSVPDDAPDKYVTYEAVVDGFDNAVTASASIWYKDTEWKSISLKEKEIYDYISSGGRLIAYDGGAMWIRRSMPWATRMSEPNDDTIRRIRLSVMIEFID